MTLFNLRSLYLLTALICLLAAPFTAEARTWHSTNVAKKDYYYIVEAEDGTRHELHVRYEAILKSYQEQTGQSASWTRRDTRQCHYGFERLIKKSHLQQPGITQPTLESYDFLNRDLYTPNMLGSLAEAQRFYKEIMAYFDRDNPFSAFGRGLLAVTLLRTNINCGEARDAINTQRKQYDSSLRSGFRHIPVDYFASIFEIMKKWKYWNESEQRFIPARMVLPAALSPTSASFSIYREYVEYLANASYQRVYGVEPPQSFLDRFKNNADQPEWHTELWQELARGASAIENRIDIYFAGIERLEPITSQFLGIQMMHTSDDFFSIVLDKHITFPTIYSRASGLSVETYSIDAKKAVGKCGSQHFATPRSLDWHPHKYDALRHAMYTLKSKVLSELDLLESFNEYLDMNDSRRQALVDIRTRVMEGIGNMSKTIEYYDNGSSMADCVNSALQEVTLQKLSSATLDPIQCSVNRADETEPYCKLYWNDDETFDYLAFLYSDELILRP